MTTTEEGLIGSLTAYFDHGLLLIEDSESSADHRGWDASIDYVHFDTDSLYVAVQSVVDGPVEVEVYRSPPLAPVAVGLTEVFVRQFESEFGMVKIHDPENRGVLVAKGNRGVVGLRVLVDEVNWAARVVVIIQFPS
ncbi:MULTISPECIES: hypothetical protein [Amycolatopsis]|uniref:Uncharacterized protein n=1 Tax=Amycolatopsis tucumanensis TaxID=401106 RepID=A0ABP7IFV8_9PSEU|nr:hypothetical protein [Amycolatopsis tucumanensis]MCF6423977.1 hypothetical protein [Amycolatopsis tucumanensis]